MVKYFDWKTDGEHFAFDLVIAIVSLIVFNVDSHIMNSKCVYGSAHKAWTPIPFYIIFFAFKWMAFYRFIRNSHEIDERILIKTLKDKCFSLYLYFGKHSDYTTIDWFEWWSKYIKIQ